MSVNGAPSRRIRRVVVGAVVGSLAIVVASSAGALAAKPAQRAVVPSVGSGVLSGATALANTAAGAPMRVSIVLRPRHAAELKKRAANGYYRPGRFLSVSAFTARYGQPRSVIRKFVAYLHAQGVKVRVYRDRLNIGIQGSAAQINAVFGIKLKDYRVPATKARNGHAGVPAQVVHGTTQKSTCLRNLPRRRSRCSD